MWIGNGGTECGDSVEFYTLIVIMIMSMFVSMYSYNI